MFSDIHCTLYTEKPPEGWVFYVHGGLNLQMKRKFLEMLIMWKNQNRKTQEKTKKTLK